jgi:hypothetical protein
MNPRGQMIDLQPLMDGQVRLLEFSHGLRVDDLREATRVSIDTLLGIVRRADDAMIAFLPHDPEANDPHARPGEEQIGWSLGHLVAHVTASSEESAAISAILARGIPYPREPRLRYETPWQAIDTQAKAVQRLEESRRMRLAALDMWPDQPHLDVLRELSERGREIWGDLNAPAAFLLGLKHEVGHYAQFHEVLRQALAARTVASAGD